MLRSDATRALQRRMPAFVPDRINMVLVEVKSATLQDLAIKGVKAVVPGSIVSSYACYKPAAQVMGMNERALHLAALFLAVFAAAFALKSQFAAVVERRRDIGILKAIGWTDGAVVRQILTESLLQAVIGAALGCVSAAALLAAAPVKEWSGIVTPVSITVLPGVLLAGAGIALAVGVLAGIVPAFVAARHRPAEAMRRL